MVGGACLHKLVGNAGCVHGSHGEKDGAFAAFPAGGGHQHTQPVNAAHHHIHQHHGGVALPDLLQQLPAVLAAKLNIKALILQGGFTMAAEFPCIINKQQ